MTSFYYKNTYFLTAPRKVFHRIFSYFRKIYFIMYHLKSDGKNMGLAHFFTNYDVLQFAVKIAQQYASQWEKNDNLEHTGP